MMVYTILYATPNSPAPLALPPLREEELGIPAPTGALPIGNIRVMSQRAIGSKPVTETGHEHSLEQDCTATNADVGRPSFEQ
jgi:hypothetical protein